MSGNSPAMTRVCFARLCYNPLFCILDFDSRLGGRIQFPVSIPDFWGRRPTEAPKGFATIKEIVCNMAYVIAEPCVGTKDTACVDACPVDCIHPKEDEEDFETAELLYIEPDECIDCGACVPVCPVSAIFALEDLPEKWDEYTEKNAAYYGKTAE